MTAPLFLFGLFRAMGAGEQIVTSAVFVLVVLYLLRSRRMARTAIGLVGTLWIVTVAVAITAAVAVALGWITIRPGVIFADLATGAGALKDWIFGGLDDWIRGLV